MKRRPRAGFTAEELIVVLGLIFIGMSGYLIFTRHVREDARMTTCASNLKQLGLAARMYMAENSGHMPPPVDATVGLQAYIKSQQLFMCPTAEVTRRRRGEEVEWSGQPPYPTDYIFSAAAQGDDPAATLVAADNAPRHLRRTWLAVRVDGGIRRFDGPQWEEYWGEVTHNEARQ